MNFVFWLICAIAIFLIWYGLRKLFKHIGGNVLDRKNEMSDIIHDREPPIFRNYDYEYFKEEFKKYFKIVNK